MSTHIVSMEVMFNGTAHSSFSRAFLQNVPQIGAKVTIEHAVELALNKDVDEIEGMLDYIEHILIADDESDELEIPKGGSSGLKTRVENIMDAFPPPPTSTNIYETQKDEDDVLSEQTAYSEHGVVICTEPKPGAKYCTELDYSLINMVIDEYIDFDDPMDIDSQIEGLFGSVVSTSTSLSDINPSMYCNNNPLYINFSDDIEPEKHVPDPRRRQQLSNMEEKRIRRHEKYIWNADMGFFEKYYK